MLGRSEFSVQWPRGVVLNKDLEAGDYVLHVSRQGVRKDKDSSPDYQVRLDRNYHRQKVYIDRFIWVRCN